jgi:glycosyltransferase involved in cell wall biosynthesis
VEAQAAGRPVIARHGGGALETVIDGVTGCFWTGGVTELAEAVRSFDVDAVDPQRCLENAARFDRESFHRAMRREAEIAIAAGTTSTEEGGVEHRMMTRSRMPGTRRAWGMPTR